MKKFQIAFICFTITFGLLSCKPGSNAGQNCAPATTDKHFKLSFVTNNASDYWTIARKGVEKADCELGSVDVEFKMPGEGTAAEQKRIIDDLISTGVNGIAMSPVDPDNQTQLINDTAKKALVITQDSDAPNSDRALYIGTDNVAAGRQASGRVAGTSFRFREGRGARHGALAGRNAHRVRRRFFQSAVRPRAWRSRSQGARRRRERPRTVLLR